MRFLVDECTGPAVAQWLRLQNHDVISVFDEMRGADDIEVLQKSNEQNRILITNDKDFGELIFREQKPHAGVILLRLEDERGANKIAVLKRLLEKCEYIKGNPDDFNRELALDTKTIFAFLQESQPEAWKKSVSIHGSDTESKILQRLIKELDNRGTLDVLRNGFIDYGVRYKMAFFKPASDLNPEAERLYDLNRLTVTRLKKRRFRKISSIL